MPAVHGAPYAPTVRLPAGSADVTALLLAMVTTPTAMATAVTMAAGGVALAAAIGHDDDRGT